ncbi:hypothetical protein Efla_003891 [Eimeria flavescens]
MGGSARAKSAKLKGQRLQHSKPRALSMLPICTARLPASPGGPSVSAAATGTDKSSISEQSYAGVVPLTSCVLTLPPPPVLRLLADRFGACGVAGSAEQLKAAEAAACALDPEAASFVDTAEARLTTSDSAAGKKEGEGGATEVAFVGETLAFGDDACYEEVSVQELEFDALEQQFVYPCPCGDLFELPLADLRAAAAAANPQGFAVASCPSCSLRIRVLFEVSQLKELEKEFFISILPDHI